MGRYAPLVGISQGKGYTLGFMRGLFLHGEYTVDDAVFFYDLGLFTSSGHLPATSQADDWLSRKAAPCILEKQRMEKSYGPMREASSYATQIVHGYVTRFSLVAVIVLFRGGTERAAPIGQGFVTFPSKREIMLIDRK